MAQCFECIHGEGVLAVDAWHKNLMREGTGMWRRAKVSVDK